MFARLQRCVILILVSLAALVSCQSYDDGSPQEFEVQVLGINDFHGQIQIVKKHGGMVQLSRHLLHAIESSPHPTFILHAGDHVGASPAESALLQDEPSISFLNKMNDYCQQRSKHQCQIIGAAGNHEFDEGRGEMLRLLDGGNHENGPFLQQQWQGANYVTLGANVLDKQTKQSVLPPYVIHTVNGVPIGFIGITLDITPEMVVPGLVDDLIFEQQAATVKKYVNVLQAKNIEAIVVIAHDGSSNDYYEGPTKKDTGINMDSHFGRFVYELPDAVDLIVSGHSHRFTNAYVKNKNQKQFLVTQAFSSGRAYSDISLTINKNTGDIINASANVIKTKASTNLEMSTKAQSVLNEIQQLEISSVEFAKTISQQYIGEYKQSDNEQSLGRFIADSHRFAMHADLAVMNKGGVRASLTPGEVRWGDLFAVQPFSNPLVVKEYSGAQLQQLIDGKANATQHYFSQNVVITDNKTITINGKKLVDTQLYKMAGNAYIMNSERFSKAPLIKTKGVDIDATIAYIKRLPQPFNLSSTPE